MRQNNNVGAQEMISMEEYLEKRQEMRKTQSSGKRQKGESTDRNTALELAALFV